MRATSFKCRALEYGLPEDIHSPEYDSEVVDSSMSDGSEEDERERVGTLYIPFVQRVICQGILVGRFGVEVLIMCGFPLGSRQTMWEMAASVDPYILTDSQLTGIRQWKGDHTMRQVTREEIDWEIIQGIHVLAVPYLRRWEPGCWTLFDLAFEDQVHIVEEVVEPMDEVMDSPDPVDDGSWAMDTFTRRQCDDSEAGPSSSFYGCQ